MTIRFNHYCRITFAVIWGIVLFLSTELVFSQETNVKSTPSTERILQSEIKQQQIRSSTQRVGEQLKTIIEEFERNGITGEDIQVLKSVESVLGELSDRDMLRIIELLQQARLIPDYTASQTRMLEAFSTQKSIIIKLKQLLDEFKKQQALYELSILFNRLAERQNANLKEAVALEPLIQNRSIDKLSDSQKVPLQVQSTEQEFIKEESMLAISKLETLARDTTTATAEYPGKGLDIVAKTDLKNLLQKAVDDLRSARLYSAIGNEKKIRDTFREIARELIPTGDTVENLRRALKDLESLIAEQKAIVKQTEELKQNKQDINKEIAARQLDLSDRTDLLKEQIKNQAPEAASNLKDSINQMQEAHSILNSNEGRWRAADALAKEKESLKNLEQAKADIEKQLASALAESQKPADNLARLKDLLNRVENLINEQTNLSASATEFEKSGQLSKLSGDAAKQQQQLKQQTREVQTESAPISLQAADELEMAAEQMNKSEKALAKGKNDPASQQAAVDALKRAANELKNSINNMEKTAADLAASEDALQKLSETIKNQQELNKETAKIAETHQQRPSPPEQVKPLAGKQAGIAENSKALQQKLSPIAPEAVQPIQNAIQNMQSAESHLAQNQPQPAREPQANALDNLYRAKNVVENRLNDLKQQLGLPPQSPSDLARAEGQIEEAQQQINEALSNLAPAGLIDRLAQRQQAVAKNLARHGKKSGKQSPQINQAHQSALKAAQQLAQADLKNAIATMSQAEEKIQQAMSSDQSQSGEKAGQSEKVGSEKSPSAGSDNRSSQGAPNQAQTGKSSSTPSHQGNPKSADGNSERSSPSGKNDSNSPDRSGNKGQPVQGENQPAQPQTAQNPTEEPPPLSNLYQEQNEIRQIAQQLLETMQTPLQDSIAKAAQNLNSASAIIGNLAATATGLPQPAQGAIQQANGSLMNASAQASAKNPTSAQQNAIAAQSALSKASAAIKMAQSGMGSQKMASNQTGNANGQGQQQGQSSGNQSQSQEGQPGQGQQGNGTGMRASQQRTAGTTGKSQGNSGNWYGQGGDKGQRNDVRGSSRFIGLPAREREAILQSQSEKYPQDYASYIEQYMKNLSDEASK